MPELIIGPYRHVGDGLYEADAFPPDEVDAAIARAAATLSEQVNTAGDELVSSMRRHLSRPDVPRFTMRTLDLMARSFDAPPGRVSYAAALAVAHKPPGHHGIALECLCPECSWLARRAALEPR